jgi:hypothetical protein
MEEKNVYEMTDAEYWEYLGVKTITSDDELDKRVMPQTCTDCGFTKVTTQADFMIHMRLHWELDEILDGLGVIQDRLQLGVSLAEGSEEG